MPARAGAGRPRTPTNLALLRGNPGKRPLPKNEPKPKPGLPPAPDWLDETARGFYERIGTLALGMKVMTEADGPALEMAAAAYSEYRTATGATAKGDAWRRVQSALVQFGLTPSSRGKVQTVGDAKEKDPLDEFLG